MADNKYCSAKFKTGEELDEALRAALDTCDYAASASECRSKAEEHRLAAEAAKEAAESAEEQAREWLNRTCDHQLIAETAAYNAKGYAEGGVVTSYPDAEEYWYSDVPGAKWYMEQAQEAAEATQKTSVDVTEIEGGHQVTITAANGEKTFLVMDGEQGPAGMSIKGETGDPGPRGEPGKDGSDGVGVSAIKQTTTSTADGGNNVFTVTLTNGTTATFTVKNGSKGSTGASGVDGNGIKSAVLNSDYTLTLTFDDGTSYTTPSIRGEQGPAGLNIKGDRGEPGQDGQDGQDGVGISFIEVEETTVPGGKNTVTIELDNGNRKTFGVYNGADGVDGKDGTSVFVSDVHESSLDNGQNVITFSNGSALRVKNGSRGSTGEAGTSVTVTNVSESTDDGGSNVVTFSDGKTLTVKNGSKGSTGATGAAGSNGKDGTSVTVTNVTTSSADGGSNVVTFSDGKILTVKNGTKGSTGSSGKDGTSVTITDTTESTADGGYNSVEFSDGTILRIRNGSRGSTGVGKNGADGYTPVRGTDYWTEADKAEIKAYVDEAILGGAW